MDIRQISEKFQLNDTESSVLQFMYSRTKNLKEMSIVMLQMQPIHLQGIL